MQKTRRQFSIDIVRCDGFVSMPATAQALYLQLVMSCDDEGFTSQLQMCKFLAHADDKDVEMLIKRNFIIQFKNDGEPTVTVIKHWRMNNWIQGGKVVPSQFSERNLVYVNANGNYTIDPKAGKPLPNRRHTAKVAEDLSATNQEPTDLLPTSYQDPTEPLETEQRKKGPKKEKPQLNPTQSNSTQSNPKIKPDKTRYKQFALLEILVDSGFISWDEVDDGWDDELDYYVQRYGFVDTKIKVKYFLSCTCQIQITGEDKMGKPIFGRRYEDEGQIANKLCYFDEALTKSFTKLGETDDGGSDDDLF